MSTTGESGKWRSLSGWQNAVATAALVIPVLAASLWVIEAQHYVGVLVYGAQFLAFVLGSALVACFLNIRSRPGEAGDRVPWYDWGLAVLSIVATGFVVLNYSWLVYELSKLTPVRIGLGVAAILLVMEATRRLIGWTLILVAVAFILYARFGDLMPGIFALPPSKWERISVYVFLDSNALLGIPLKVAAQTIITFILFGSILRATKGDKFITDVALSLMGRYRGGPAKVSVAASTLFGTVSGSAVSNVAVVGPLSIPMMERSGYQKHQAAAIEAVSSTGGQIMPPVMGITAFLMADFLAIPYREVVLAALLPALLYYVAVFAQVDLEAAKNGLRGLRAADLPKLLPTLKGGLVFLVPLVVMIYAVVFAFWAPGKAGLAAAVTALVVGSLSRTSRPSRADVAEAILATGRTSLSIVILTAIAGVVIGALQLAGLGYSMSSILLSLAGDSVFLILLMTGIVCVILGMALPTAVIYTMLAVLVAPALVQLGVDRLAAHFFIFYMGMLSMITPPVCFATFTAASIAGSGFWKTAFSGMRFGIAAYLLPFVFPFSLGLLMMGGVVEVTVAFVTAVFGLTAISAGLVGYLFRPLNLVFRAALCLGGFAAMLSPFESRAFELANFVGLGVCLCIGIFEYLRTPRGGASGAATTSVASGPSAK